MGQAADIIDNASTRKRSDKALRGHGYTGNLIAFKNVPNTAISAQGRTAMARFKAMQPTAEKNLQLQQSVQASTQVASSIPMAGLQKSSHPVDQTAANSGFAGVQSNSSTLPYQKRALTAAVVGSLTVGAILGSVWNLSRTPTEVAPESKASVAPITPDPMADQQNRVVEQEIIVEQEPIIKPDTAIEPKLLTDETAIAVSTIDSPDQVIDKLPASEPLQPQSIPDEALQTRALQEQVLQTQALQSQVVGFQEEINWLNEQNTSLTLQVEELTNETLQLNQELLVLELELASTAPVTETKVVYNFVNVPIGGTEEPVNYNSYPEPVVYEESTAYSQDNQYIDESTYVEPLEYRDVYGYAEQGEPVYDPETGLYLSPEMLDNSAQQYDTGQQYIEQGTQVIYPPVAPDAY